MTGRELDGIVDRAALKLAVLIVSQIALLTSGIFLGMQLAQ